jgi:dihydroxyacetone kinase-like predicted kinase
MMEIVENMRSGEVTYSVRDTELSGVKIKEGDFIGITRGEILISNPNRVETVKKLLDDMIDESREIVTFFFGLDISEDEMEEIIAYAKKLNPDIEVDNIMGKQDIYSYIIAVE